MIILAIFIATLTSAGFIGLFAASLGVVAVSEKFAVLKGTMIFILSIIVLSVRFIFCKYNRQYLRDVCITSLYYI